MTNSNVLRDRAYMADTMADELKLSADRFYENDRDLSDAYWLTIERLILRRLAIIETLKGQVT